MMGMDRKLDKGMNKVWWAGTSLLILVGCVVLTLLVGGLVLSGLDASLLDDLARQASRWPLYLFPIRWGLYALLVWKWQWVCAWLVRRYGWSVDVLSALIALRYRVLVIAAVVEVFVNLAVPLRIIALLK